NDQRLLAVDLRVRDRSAQDARPRPPARRPDPQRGLREPRDRPRPHGEPLPGGAATGGQARPVVVGALLRPHAGACASALQARLQDRAGAGGGQHARGRKPQYEGMPQRMGIFEDLVGAYMGIDPAGYEQQIREALAYVETLITPALESRRHSLEAN